MILFIITLLQCQAAAAYEPEDLLRKTIAPMRALAIPGSNQYLNPFNKVGVSVTQLDLHSGKEREIALNLNPKGWLESAEYKTLAQTLTTDITITDKLNRSQNLQTAYSALIAAALAIEQNASSQEFKDLMAKSLKLSALEARRDRADVKNVLKANADLQKSFNEMIENDAKIVGIKKFLHERGFSLNELATSDLLGADEILMRLDHLNEGKAALTTQKLLSEHEVTRSNANHATALRSKWIDGVKFAYRQEKKENSLRVELGINLPFLAAQNLDDYKDSLKIAQSEIKTQQGLFEENQRLAGITESLRQKIVLYRTMNNFPEINRSQNLLRQDPALAIELQRANLGLRFAKASLLAEIRAMYISVLLENEVLASEPNINHLSRSNRKI